MTQELNREALAARWSPYQIEIILHHHCSWGPFPRESAPLYLETLQDLIARNVLHHVDGRVSTTPLGTYFVQMLLNTPLPRMAFVDPRSLAVQP